MAIINTLLTAVDRTSGVLDSVSKNVKKSTSEIQGSLDKASDSSATFENSFDKLRNIDMTSLSGVIDIIKEIQDQMDTATDDTQKFLIRMGALAGGAAALGFGIMTAVNASAEYVNGLNETATVSGTTIERLQQMQTVFRSTAMEVEKFGDINKDALDHLGDAFRDGSGPAEDMKAYGLNLQDFNKYLNKTNGGIDAVIHSFYEMRKAGKSNAEITNMMETLASDSSHLVSTLKQYGTEQEALNAINNTSAGITAEVAEKYKEYDQKVKQLETSFMTFQANALTPTIDEINNLLEVMNSDFDNTKLSKWFNDFYYGGDNIISKFLRDMDGVDARFINGTAENRAAKADNNFPPVNTEKETPTGGWVDKDKAAAAADAAAKKAEAAAAAFKKQQEQAQKWLNQLDINNATELKKAEINYNAQLKQLDDLHAKKIISQEQYNHGVQALNSQLDEANRTATEQSRIESATRLRDQGVTSEYDYQQSILKIKSDFQQQALTAQYNTEMERIDYLHQAGLMKEEQYQSELAGLKSKYAYDSKNNKSDLASSLQNVEYKKSADQLQVYANAMSSATSVASSFGDIITSSAEEGSAAWIAATVATKGMAVAQAIIMANLAAAQALASPAALTLPQKIAESNIVRTMGYANAAMIAAQGIASIAGAREKGGQVMAGSTYLVGEKGPELFTAGATGNITPNNELGGNSTNSFNQTNHFYQSGISSQDAEMIKNMTSSMIDQRLNTEKRYGGKLA